MHPAIPAQQHCMLHRRGIDHTDPYHEGARRLICSKELDAQAYARRRLKRGRFAKKKNKTEGRTSSRTR